MKGNMRYDTMSKLQLVGGILLIVLIVLWCIAEFTVTKSFVGTLVIKDVNVTYHRDTEDDEITARRRYVLTFYAEGDMREVVVEKQSATVSGWSEARARERLEYKYSEPAQYTHATVSRTYVVKTRGWILDDNVIELTDLATIAAE